MRILNKTTNLVWLLTTSIIIASFLALWLMKPQLTASSNNQAGSTQMIANALANKNQSPPPKSIKHLSFNFGWW